MLYFCIKKIFLVLLSGYNPAAVVDFYLFYDELVDTQCIASDTQVTVKARGPLVNAIRSLKGLLSWSRPNILLPIETCWNFLYKLSPELQIRRINSD